MFSWLSNIVNAFSKEKDERSLLLEQLREAQKTGLIDIDALGMIEGVFQVSEMRVRDIMVPRTHMVVIHEDMRVEDMIPIIAESGHSRFPVVDDSIDEVVGVLLAKDLAHYSNEENRRKFELKDILRSAVFVPESKRLNVLLNDFRTSRNHMAMVVDEYSGISGLVTIEDVLEEIVGEIDDEHDAADTINISRHGFHRYTINGLTPIEEFNKYFDEQFSADKFDTIAGLVVNKLGHLAERGDEVVIKRYTFKVISANSRRINNMQVVLPSSNKSKSE